MYLSLLGVRVDSKLHDPQERSAEAPTLCFQARPLSALAVAPEMKSPLGLGQPLGLSDGQGVLQTLEIILMSPPSCPDPARCPAQGEAESQQPPALTRDQHKPD